MNRFIFFCLLASPAIAAPVTPKPAPKTPVAPFVMPKTITGRVLNEQGAPIPNALIVASWSSNAPTTRTRSDAQGRFSLLIPTTRPAMPAYLRTFFKTPAQRAAWGNSVLEDLLHPTLWAFADGHGATMSRASVPFYLGSRAPALPKPRLITMPKGGSVAGIAIDASGTPLPNVRVKVDNWQLSAPNLDRQERFVLLFPGALPPDVAARFVVVTDGKGAFRFDDLPLDANTWVVSDDAVWTSVNVSGQRVGDGKINRVPLQAGGSVRGRIVDELGKPVANAQVSVWSREERFRQENGRWGSAVSDASGAFTVSRLLPGTYFAGAAPWSEISRTPAQTRAMPVSVEAKRKTEVQLRTIRPAIVTVKVSDARSGKPAPRMRLTVRGYDHAPVDEQLFTTRENGECALSLPSGRYAISAVPATGARRDIMPAPQTLDVRAGEKRAFALRVEAGHALRGRIVDERGRPVTNALIFLSVPDGGGEGFSANAKGEFQRNGLAPGRYTFRTDAFLDDKWEVVSPSDVLVPQERAVTVTLRRTRKIALQGRVVTPQGEVVANAQVRFQVTSGRGTGASSQRMNAKSNAQGVFVLPGLHANQTVTLFNIERDGYEFGSGGVVNANPKSFAISDVVLRPLSARAIGVVRDDHNAPIPNALVFVPGGARVRSDENGRFSLPVSEIATIEVWALSARASGHAALHPGVDGEIRLQNAPLAPSGDLARALPLLREAAPNLSSNDALRATRVLARFDPFAAVAIGTQSGNFSRERAHVWAISEWCRAHPERAQTVLPMLDGLAETHAFVESSAHLGIALAGRAPEIAGTLLQNASARVGANVNQDNAQDWAAMAALAAALNRDDADAYLQSAIVGAGNDSQRAYEVMYKITLGPAEPVEKFLQTHPNDAGLFAVAASQLAFHDVASAQRFFEVAASAASQMPKGEARMTAEHSLADAARSLILALGASNPELVPALARRVPNAWERQPLLLLAASYARPQDAKSLLDEAAPDATHLGGISDGGPGVAAHLATLRARTDAPGAQVAANTALELFAEAHANGFGENPGQTGYFLSFVAPEDARALLEDAWARRESGRQKLGFVSFDAANLRAQLANERSEIATGMAALDVERATQMARALPDKTATAEILADIARFLLENDQERMRREE